MISVTVITPDGTIWSNDQVSQFSVTTASGYITVLPEHTALTSLVPPGELEVRFATEDDLVAVGQGILHVKDNTATFLVDSAHTAELIDEQQTEQAKQRAEALLADVGSIDEGNLAKIQADLSRELAKLKVLQFSRKRRSR